MIGLSKNQGDAMSETRKLAAILAADVAGYSRLAGADEERTLARLRALRRDLIDPTIAVHHEPAARELARQHDLAFRVDGVNLKDLLRQIEPNPRDSGQIPDRLAHGRLPCLEIRSGILAPCENSMGGSVRSRGEIDFRDYFCSAPLRAPKFGRAATCRGVFARTCLVSAPSRLTSSNDAAPRPLGDQSPHFTVNSRASRCAWA